MNALNNVVNQEELSCCRITGNDFWPAVKESIPLLVGVIPFGITCGIMGLTVGMTSLETVLMSLMVFAGASQFMVMSLIGSGITGWGILVFTTLLINLRHLLMGASLAPHMSRLPFIKQAVLAFFLVDESYAFTINRTDRAGYSPSYQLGVSLALYLTWFISTVTGLLVGGQLANPLEWGLDFAMPATFLVLLMPRLVDTPSIMACLVSAVLSVWGALYLPGKWYIILACVAATLAGGLIERRTGDAQ